MIESWQDVAWNHRNKNAVRDVSTPAYDRQYIIIGASTTDPTYLKGSPIAIRVKNGSDSTDLILTVEQAKMIIMDLMDVTQFIEGYLKDGPQK